MHVFVFRRWCWVSLLIGRLAESMTITYHTSVDYVWEPGRAQPFVDLHAKSAWMTLITHGRRPPPLRPTSLPARRHNDTLVVHETTTVAAAGESAKSITANHDTKQKIVITGGRGCCLCVNYATHLLPACESRLGLPVVAAVPAVAGGSLWALAAAGPGPPISRRRPSWLSARARVLICDGQNIKSLRGGRSEESRARS